MAKVKNKRNSGLADKVHSKKKGDIHKKKLNPFEVHINREKIKVLGKKSKHDRGLPGVSRAKAIQKRKETLGTEMKLMNKTNTFIDKRIGEKNNTLSAEDRMIARFAAERARQHGRKDMYNLADDEVLTHRGQTLEQIEKFDDPRSDEEDDEKTFGGLDTEFVSEGHFGGGMLSKSEKDGAKSHKDLIEQLIAESKKRKADKQKEKEQTLDLTEQLDTQWKDLQPVVFKKMRVEEPKQKEQEKESVIDKLLKEQEKKSTDYDTMMRELKFEKRGTPSDGLKSDEKQAKEERQRLETLERERQQRMLADHEMDKPKAAVAASKHRSADDLDDNFELDDEKEFMLAYDKDGKPLVPEHILNDYSVPNAKPKFQDGISDTSSDEDGDESDGSVDDESQSKKAKVNRKPMNDEVESEDESIEEQGDVKDIDETSNKTNVDESQNKSDSDESDDENSDESEEKSDIKQTDVKGIDRRDKVQTLVKEKQKINDESNTKTKETRKIDRKPDTNNEKSQKSDTSILFQKPQNEEQSDESGSDEDESDSGDGSESGSDEKADKRDDLSDLRKSDQDSDGDENDDDEVITSFFDLKTSEGDNLKELLADKSPYQQSVALQKLIKSYDPSLAEKNKDLLSRLYAHMLQYIHDIFTDLQTESDVLKAFLIFDKLAPHFYELAVKNKVSCKKFIVELLKEKHDKYKKRPKVIPDLNTLIFFKLISLIYPTSDFKHPVCSPALLFMSEILTTAKFTDAKSISRGFFVTTLILEYTVLSKRFVPSAINFLRGILYLSANTSILNPIQVVPPFRLHKDAKILNLDHDYSNTKMAVTKMAAKDLLADKIDDDFKIRCLLTTTMIIKEFFNNLNELEAQECIFEPHLQLYSRIDLELYPKKVASWVSEVIQYMKASLEVKTYTPLARERKKPKALRLYEPDIQEVFTGNKNAKLPRDQQERMRLQGKIKKEMKGALREIRRDTAYIASVKIRQKIHSDNVRKDKVKQIYKDAAIQQGEINQLKRIK